MPQSDIFRRYLDAGLAIGQVTTARAEEIVKELVKAGEVQRAQTQQWVDDLLERSRKNREALSELIGAEIRRQIESSPLVSRADVTRLEQRVNELAAQLNRATEGPRRAAGALRGRVQDAVGGGRGRGPGRETVAVRPAAVAPKSAPIRTAAASVKKAAPAKKAATVKKAPVKKAPVKNAPVKKAAAPAPGADSGR